MTTIATSRPIAGTFAMPRDFMIGNPPTFEEACALFTDAPRCIEYMTRMRWPDGVIICPTCGSSDVTWLPTRTLFQCKARHPKRQFSVKMGTVFDSSLIPLGKILLVSWVLFNTPDRFSSYDAARICQITQKSAWLLFKRIQCWR